MAEQARHTAVDLMTMYKATFFELPMAGTKWAWGVGKEQETVEAAWKGYDAWVGAFFGELWPVVGLPTAAAVQALQEGVQSLTARVTAQDVQIQALRKEVRALTA